MKITLLKTMIQTTYTMKIQFNIFLFASLLSLTAIGQTSEENKAKAQAATMTKTKQLKDGWSKSGSFNFNINEAGRNNAWGLIKGGEEQTVGIRALVDYDFDLKKGKNNWLNNIRARYGVAKFSSAGNGFSKTDDYVSYTSIYGRELKPKWSFTMLFNLESQFDRFFLSPGYLKLGPGFMYKPNAHFSALISPAMTNITTKFAKEQRDTLLFDVESGKTSRYGLGAFLQVKADYDIAKGINYKGFATFYSNYLNQPGSIILDWTNLFTLTVNKYIGATVSINLRNNDFETYNLQTQHAIGVGFSYKL